MRAWAADRVGERSDLVRIGYFGSYAGGGWGVGSDLDLVVVVERSDEPWERRACSWDTTSLPVASDLLVYTADEWRALLRHDHRFARVLREETVWIYPGEETPEGV
ncbi:hypothetical protein BH23GEM4_BH23GEM4_21980 [soil metagenome]